MSVPKRARQGGMPSKQLNKIQIHLSDNRSDTAVFQSVNVPTRFTNGSLASSHASLGRQPAVLRKNAINRVAIEPTFVRNEKKIGTRIGWPLFQPDPQGRNFIHTRTSPHSKERLSSLQGSLESLNCNFHVAPIDVAQLERNQFACPQGVLKANDQQGVISWAPSSGSFEDI
jgi:hypothetical protein